MIALTSALLSRVPGLTHGFGTLAEPVPEALAEAWSLTKPQWWQVHGVEAIEVSRAGQECGEVDAIWTRAPGLPIAVVTADCVPVLLARRDGRAAAAVHAGWRGTRGRILRRLWERLGAAGERPGDWVAAVGPAIGPCCYEVSAELADQFATEFAPAGPEVAVPRARYLDLPAINAAELRAAGVGEVELLRACTKCFVDGTAPGAPPAFHSYRREGGGTRQYSMLRLG